MTKKQRTLLLTTFSAVRNAPKRPDGKLRSSKIAGEMSKLLKALRAGNTASVEKHCNSIMGDYRIYPY